MTTNPKDAKPRKSDYVLNNGKCCEEAHLTANELARRNAELGEAEVKIAAQRRLRDSEFEYWSGRAEKAEAERDDLRRKLDDPYSEVNQKAAAWDRVEAHPIIGPLSSLPEGDSYAERVGKRLDQLAEMESAITELEPAEGWPDWLGPKINPDDFEVTRDEEWNYLVDGAVFARDGDTADEVRRRSFTSVPNLAKREKVARLIESEQAAADDKDQRIEKAAEKLWLADRTGVVSWNELHVDMQREYRDEAARLLDAGWAPPESEDEQ